MSEGFFSRGFRLTLVLSTDHLGQPLSTFTG
jgi:hypothetical protein